MSGKRERQGLIETHAGQALAAAAGIALVLTGQPLTDRQQPETGQTVDRHVNQWEDVKEAVAVIQPTEGNDVTGVVRFREADGGVRVTADIKGLEPNSKHGFHIHQYGDATAPDATSAGDHYDPQDTGHHGRPGSMDPSHAGDMGNLEADASGNATYNRVIEGLTVADLQSPVIGRAVIVHAQPDEFDQPTGSAGDRVGIGIIGVANPDSAEQAPRRSPDKPRSP